VVVVVVVGGAVVVVVGAGGTVVVVTGALAANSFSATEALVPVLLLGVKLATVAVALPWVVDTGTPPGAEFVGVDGATGGAVTDPLPLLPLPVPDPPNAGSEKSGFVCPGAPAFAALSVGTLTVPVLAATTTSESAAAATLTVAINRFLTIPAALGPNASAIAEADPSGPPSESGLPKFVEAKTSSRLACPSTADALSGFERCIPPPVDSASFRVFCAAALTPEVLRDSSLSPYRDESQRGTWRSHVPRSHRKTACTLVSIFRNS
jgi:hypothetical protein